MGRRQAHAARPVDPAKLALAKPSADA